MAEERTSPSLKEFSFRTREENLRRMAERPLDVFVVGGGIVGAWVALAAASRGYRTGLVEKGDFASGTSGRTSRLIHGGLRYLRQFHFGLVRQAARERDHLLKIAPDLVKPLTFLIPLYRQRGPKKWLLRLGLWLYDSLSDYDALPRRRWISATAALELEPGLDRGGLVAAALYSDAITNDARLVLAVIRAAHDQGALIANYAPALELFREGGRVRGARVVNLETSESFSVRATVVVNAAGAWASDLQGEAHRLPLRPTKGVHVLVPREPLGIRNAIVLFGTDGRLMFAIPWGRFAILGTTDTDYRGDRDGVVADRLDVDYLLHAANAYFPRARLTHADVVSSYAGLRPLVDTGESEESRISRKHVIVEDPDGLVTVVGGKLTTARAMSEEVMDRIGARFPRRFDCLSAGRAVRIEDRGAFPEENMDIPRIVREEMALHVDDVLIRRTAMFYETTDQALDQAVSICNELAVEMGWDDVRRVAELARYREVVESHRHWRQRDDARVR